MKRDFGGNTKQQGLAQSCGPAIIVLLSVFPFRSVNNCFIYFGASILGTHILLSVMFS